MKNIGLYLISGFLGAGKTTLVKSLLAQNQDKKIGIIMNEFGRISIDGPILKSEHVEMVELTRGSIFCSCLSMAFAESLVEISAKDLDYVIVESSGLADPSNIGDILEGVAKLSERPYTYLGSVNVVDASQFLAEIHSIETLKRQLECADLTFVNKIDLVDDTTKQTIRSTVESINPDTEYIETSFFQNTQAFLGKDLLKTGIKTAKASLNTPDNKPKTISIHYTQSHDQSEIETFIRQILPEAFRIKGFIAVDDKWLEVHGVGNCVDFYETDRHFDESTLVVISKVGPQIIRTIDQKWKDQFGYKITMKN